MNQADASADDKVDIFLSETDYVYKYTDAAADVAMPLTDLGIDPDKDLADQYDFTKTTASDADGVQRGSTWQCCPGLLVYRRDIAKDVFGTDDPEEVGKKMKDWDTAKAKKRNFSRSRNNDREQFSGCFKCGKHDHIVKNFSLLKEEQEPKQFRKQGRRFVTCLARIVKLCENPTGVGRGFSLQLG